MIYVPRCVIDMIHGMRARGHDQNPSVCTKIEYHGFEISVSSDSSHVPGNLVRSDIRVFDLAHGGDVSEAFLHNDERMLCGNAETLHRIMDQIREGVKK